MIPVCAKICPKCGGINHFQNNHNWLGKCKECRTIFSNLPITYIELSEIISSRPEAAQANPLSVYTIEINRKYQMVAEKIQQCRSALEQQRDYQSAIEISTLGLETLSKIGLESPGSNIDRVSLWMILLSIRSTSYYATGVGVNWDKALEDIIEAEALRSLFYNIPEDAGKSLAQMHAIRDVIQKRRHL